MNADYINIISVLLICNGTISALVSLIMLRFILSKKKTNAIYILVVGLVATNCVNAISLCFIGIFHFYPLNKNEANFTTPRICILSKPQYLIAIATSRQAAMLTLCIAVIQLRNVYFVKCNTTKVLLKSIILTCGISLLNICLCGISAFQTICCGFGDRKISAPCFYFDVLPPVVVSSNFYIMLLLGVLSFLLDISTVLIIRSKFSSLRGIREIQFIRQKAILQRLKIITIAHVLYSCVLAICTFVKNVHYSTDSLVIVILCIYPYFSAGNTVIYTNLVISVTDDLNRTYYYFKESLNRLYNSLSHYVRKVSVAPASSKDFPTVAAAKL
ncbi:hypothetical protein T01_348 [Trichinella spiralis]|uniref:Uncharacterized protein n=1 Tax=Trichinella spiralis TaxID=6334 RepID=A0A0V1BZ44_TRISP|nr:hypothetical protein T01_348 [Trichinella spiralis]